MKKIVFFIITIIILLVIVVLGIQLVKNSNSSPNVSNNNPLNEDLELKNTITEIKYNAQKAGESNLNDITEEEKEALKNQINNIESEIKKLHNSN